MNLVLGTVQFGLDYGVSNYDGKPDRRLVFDMLDQAYEMGIRTLDSAQEYGDALNVIAEYHSTSRNRFKIINKILRYPVEEASLIEESFTRLRREKEMLDIDCFECVMFHYAGTIDDNVPDTILTGLKSEGIAHKGGISIEVPNDYYQLSHKFDFDTIQLPYNVLNSSVISHEFLNELTQNNVNIHARSAFLQGVLINDPDALPENLNALKPYVQLFHASVKEHGLTPLEGALLFLHQDQRIESVVFGAQNKKQLSDIVQSYLRVQEIDEGIIDWNELGTPSAELVTPSKWGAC